MPLVEQDKQWMIEQLHALESRSNERLEQVETRLLTEFHKSTSPADARARSHAAALLALDLELEAIDERLKKVGGNQPPAS